jgi:hypothetical protein
MNKKLILNNFSLFLDELMIHSCDQFKAHNDQIGSLVTSFENLNLQFGEIKNDMGIKLAERDSVIAELTDQLDKLSCNNLTMKVDEAEYDATTEEDSKESEEESESVALIEKMLKPPDGGKRRKFYITDDEDKEIYDILIDNSPSDKPIGKLVGKNNKTHFYS